MQIKIFIEHLLGVRHALGSRDTAENKTEDGPWPPGADSLVGKTHYIINN